MKMLIQSSLPNYLSTELSFASGLGKQQDMELLCNWSNCNVIWQKFINEKCPLEKGRKSYYVEEKESKLHCSEIDEISETNCDISVVGDTCTNFASTWDRLVYKYRRMRKITVAMILEENAIESDKKINNSLISATCSSSKSNAGQDSVVMKTKGDCGKGSSSGIVADEPLEDTASRELCIAVLKSQGVTFGTSSSNVCDPSEFPSSDDAGVSQSCKVCNLSENPSKMLICDLCDDAYHVSCRQQNVKKVKKVPDDYWYCKPCLEKRAKDLLEESPANILSERKSYRKSSGRGGPILRMLSDNQPYTSGVRIDPNIQAEVPQWTGPILDDENYFDEPSELDLAECSILIDQNDEKSPISTSAGNWIQCRAYNKNSKYRRTKCQKWRRAPLFVTQTNNWECFGCVLWDPSHADCAVPQELETDVILAQKKFFEKMKPMLTAKKRRVEETRTEDPS